MGLLLAGCASAPPARPIHGTAGDPFHWLQRRFEDRTPAYVPAGALDSVVLLYDPATRTLASGTVIAPDRILTCAHVVERMSRDARGRLPVQIDGRLRVGAVVAAGDPALPHGDWAVLAFEHPEWLRVASIYEPARAITWQPAVGTEVMLVGYAAGFFPSMKIDVGAPTPCVVVHIAKGVTQRGSWIADGDQLELGGMSGGAAMIWNQDAERPELIGVFRGYLQKEAGKQRVVYTIQRLPELVRQPSSAVPIRPGRR